MADEILQKANEVVTGAQSTGHLTTPSLVNSASGGLLNTEQSDEFIDYMWDATTLAKEGRRITMRANEVDIDKLAVGERVIRSATEADGTYANSPVSFSKVTVSTKKIRLDWEVSTETGEDSIEGTGTASHIARNFATQAGNDIEDLAINGVGSGVDPFLKIMKGFYQLGVTETKASVVDWNEAAVDRAVFDAALKALPRKYKASRSRLRFYTGSGVVQDYLFKLSAIGDAPESIVEDIVRGSLAGPQGAGGGRYPLAFGVPIVEVPLFNEDRDAAAAGADTLGHVELTFPENRIWGVKRDIEFYDEFKPKKDTTEYTMYMRFGIQVENWDAYVVVNDVLVKGYTVA